jgi:carotenoid cleavage dioxygenase-like enzyme
MPFDSGSEIYKLAREMYIREMTNVRPSGDTTDIDGWVALGLTSEQEMRETAHLCIDAAAAFINVMNER